MTSVAGVEHATALRPIDPVGGASDFHLVDTYDGPHLLVVDGSLLFKIDEDFRQRLVAAQAQGTLAARAMLTEHGLCLKRYIGDQPLVDPPLRTLSLAVAARCNLGCTYCYAEGGSFGGNACHRYLSNRWWS